MLRSQRIVKAEKTRNSCHHFSMSRRLRIYFKLQVYSSYTRQHLAAERSMWPQAAGCVLRARSWGQRLYLSPYGSHLQRCAAPLRPHSLELPCGSPDWRFRVSREWESTQRPSWRRLPGSPGAHASCAEATACLMPLNEEKSHCGRE